MAPVANTDTDQLKRLKFCRNTIPLGHGTFAAVYRGKWDGRPCAVKVLLPKHANACNEDPAAPLPPVAAMLQREGEALMRHPHKHLVRCLAVLSLPPTFPGLPPGYLRPVPSLILEFMEAGSLSGLIRLQHLSPWRPLYSTPLALRWASQVAAALLHMHRQLPPLLHRDVKADNVMLARENGGRSTRLEARLGDLGLHMVPTEHPRSKLQPPLLRAPLPEGTVMDSSSHHRRRSSGVQSPAPTCGPLAASSPSVPKFFVLIEGQGGERDGAQLVSVELKRVNKSRKSSYLPQSYQQPSSQLAEAAVSPRVAVPGSQMDARTRPYDGFSPPPGPRMEELSRVASPSCTADGAAVAVNARLPPIVSSCDGAPFPTPGAVAVAQGPLLFPAPRSSPSLTSVAGQQSTPSTSAATAAAAAVGGYSYAFAGGGGGGGGGGSGTRPPWHSGTFSGGGGGGGRRSCRVAPTPSPASPLPVSATLSTAVQVSAQAPSPPFPQPPVVAVVPLRSLHIAAEGGGGDDYGESGGGTTAVLTPAADAASTTRANSGTDCCSRDTRSPDDVTTSESSGQGASARTRSGLSYRALSSSDCRTSGSEMVCIAETTCGGGWRTSTPATVNRGSNSMKSNVAGSTATPYGRAVPGAVEVKRLCSEREREPESVQAPGLWWSQRTAPGAALAITTTSSSKCGTGGGGGLRNAGGGGSGRAEQQQPQEARGCGDCVGDGERGNARRSKQLPPPVAVLGSDMGLVPCDTAGLYERVYCLTSATGSYTTMAPEVYIGLPYNEKADVFSFGVVLYELLSRSLLVNSHVGVKQPGLPHVLPRSEDYAAAVAKGYRPARTPHISDPLWSLICACWHPDPLHRPTMAQVVQRLTQLVAESEEAAAAAEGRCGGCLRKAGIMPDDDDLDLLLVEDHMGCGGGGGGCTIC